MASFGAAHACLRVEHQKTTEILVPPADRHKDDIRRGVDQPLVKSVGGFQAALPATPATGAV